MWNGNFETTTESQVPAPHLCMLGLAKELWLLNSTEFLQGQNGLSAHKGFLLLGGSTMGYIHITGAC